MKRCPQCKGRCVCVPWAHRLDRYGCPPQKAHGSIEMCTPLGTQVTQVCVPPAQAHGSHRCAHVFLMFVSAAPNPCCGSPGAEGDTRDSKGRRSKRTGGIAQILCFGATHGGSGALAVQLVSTPSQEQRCPNTAGSERMGTATLCALREPHCHPGQERHHFPRAAALLNTKLQIISYLDQRCACSSST